MAKKFSKKEAIKFGWQIMKQNIGFFIGLSVVAGLIFIVPNVISSLLEKESGFLAFIINIIGTVLSMIVSLGLIKISLNFCDNLKSKIADIFSQYRLFFKYLLASISYSLIFLGSSLFLLIILVYLYRLFFKYLLASIRYDLIFLGSLFLLIIILGIYLAIRFRFYGYFIVDRRSGIIESLKKSWQITQGSVWNLFLFGLLLGLINLLGVLVLIVGLFATLPTTMVAMAFVYRKLLTQSETSEETKDRGKIITNFENYGQSTIS